MSQRDINRVADNSDAHSTHTINMVTGKLFRPIFVLLKLSGVFVDHTDHSKRKIVYSYVYCVLLAIMYIVDALRYSAIYRNDQFNQYSSSQVAFMIFVTLNMWQTPTFCIGQLYLLTKHAHNITRTLHSYEEVYSIDMDTQKPKRRRIKLLVSLFYVFISTFCLFTFLPETAIFSTILYGFHYTNYSEKVLPVFYLSLKSTIASFAGSSTVCLVREVVLLLVSEYGRITRKMDALIKNDAKADSEDMVEHYRRQHQALTDLLQTANPVIQFYVLVTLAFGLPTTCFLVYSVASGELMLVDVVVLWYVLLSSLVGYLYITRIGANLNSKAHEIRDILLRFDMSRLSKAAIQQVQIFISQVNGPPIGIQIYNMFVVDASSILTIAGTILTYTIVIYQTSGPTNCSCNTTSDNVTF